MIYLTLAAAYFACSALSYGLMLGYWCGEYTPREEGGLPCFSIRGHRAACAIDLLGGPMALAASIVFLAVRGALFKHGLRF